MLITSKEIDIVREKFSSEYLSENKHEFDNCTSCQIRNALWQSKTKKILIDNLITCLINCVDMDIVLAEAIIIGIDIGYEIAKIQETEREMKNAIR